MYRHIYRWDSCDYVNDHGYGGCRMHTWLRGYKRPHRITAVKRKRWCNSILHVTTLCNRAGREGMLDLQTNRWIPIVRFCKTLSKMNAMKWWIASMNSLTWLEVASCTAVEKIWTTSGNYLCAKFFSTAVPRFIDEKAKRPLTVSLHIIIKVLLNYSQEPGYSDEKQTVFWRTKQKCELQRGSF